MQEVVDSNMSVSGTLVENGDKPGQDSRQYFIFMIVTCPEILGIQRVNKIIRLKGELLLLQDSREDKTCLSSGACRQYAPHFTTQGQPPPPPFHLPHGPNNYEDSKP